MWCPFAVHQPIPETYTQGRITPTTIIDHEAVSWADSLYGYWTTGGVELESHFYVGRTGVIYQFVDTNVRADANYSANGFAVSIETWDAGGDVAGTWNPEQLAALKRLHAWLCAVHPTIPKAAATSWSGGGIGGHNWFAAEWAGGPRACPGPNRSAQLRNEIIPFVAGGGDWQLWEDELASSDEILAAIQDIRNDLSTRYRNSGQTDSTGLVLDRLGWMFPALDNDWIAQQPGAVVPVTLTNAIASTYRLNFEQFLPKLNAISAAIAQLAEADSVISLSPDQLEALTSDTALALQEQLAALQDQMAAAQEQAQTNYKLLVDKVTEISGMERREVLSALDEWYGRAVAPASQ